MRTHDALIRRCLAEYQGVEITHTGDGVEASFPTASSAVECAIAIQKAFAKHNRERPADAIEVRIGIHAGDAIQTEGRLFGMAVYTAFRICQRARPRQVLVSDVVHNLASGKGFTLTRHGRVALKGLAGRIRLYEVSWKEAQTQRSA
jgi:class 3 adenylate cyclase